MGATRHLPAVVGAPVAIELAPQTADTQVQAWLVLYALSHSVVHGGTVETSLRLIRSCQ
jgi:hypothetical protein